MKSRSSEKRSILVTGGAGYIGTHTCKALAAAGYLVVREQGAKRLSGSLFFRFRAV
jgi:nucleoside-diphosphate-sugar epimerase